MNSIEILQDEIGATQIASTRRRQCLGRAEQRVRDESGDDNGRHERHGDNRYKYACQPNRTMFGRCAQAQQSRDGLGRPQPEVRLNFGRGE